MGAGALIKKLPQDCLVKNSTKYISYCLYFKAENKFIFCFFAA